MFLQESAEDDGRFDAPPDPSLPPLRLRQLPDESWVRRIDLSAPGDTVLEVLDQTAALVQRARELRSLAEDLAVEWIGRHGELTLGDIRYYAGHRSITRCTDLRVAVELLLEGVGGDLEGFAALLSSNAFRHGGCRSVLAPEQFSQVFATESRVELREGAPRKRLLRADTRFTRPQGEARP